jgi:hypothetical protein
VRIAGEIRATISNLHAQARAAGTGAEFAAAVCRIVERLQAVPWEFGEPLCRLPALRLQLRQAILGPVAAVYAVHEDLGLVFFRRIKALSSVIGPEDRPTPPATGRIRIIRSEDYQGEPLLFRELTPDELAEAYRLARESFTAADLQEYTELDEGVPAEQVLAELEAAQQAFDREDQ